MPSTYYLSTGGEASEGGCLYPFLMKTLFVLRALPLALSGALAFTLAFWQALEMVTDWNDLDWGVVARAAADNLLLDVQLLVAVREVERLKAILVARGVAC